MRKKLTAAALLALAVLTLNACSGQTSAETDTETAQTEATEAETIKETEAESSKEAEEAGRGTGEAFTCSEADAHAITAAGAEAAYDNILVEKTGDSEQNDEADFYGTNAAVYAENGANLTLKNSLIKTDASHANAVFSYGEGTTVNISDSTIETSKNNSGGIMVTGGGTLNADNLDVTTQGGSSAAIRSDRGGGTINVNGGTYKSCGSGSPAIYSTADINVTGAELYSDVSQAVVVEGKNSVTLIDTDAVGKNTKHNSDKSDREQAVMIYQSMSGDAGEGKSVFNMTGGSLTSLAGGMFFVTNTISEINLDSVELNYASDDLLRIEAAGWGKEGSNGGQTAFTANDQSLKGIITVDDISKLNLVLNKSSDFEGSISSTGEVYVELNDASTWKLTGDSSVSSLTCGENAIDLNGYTLTVGGKEYTEGTASTGTALELKAAENSGNMQAPPSGDHGNPPAKPDGSDGHMAPPSGDNGNPPAKPDGSDGHMAPPSGDNGNPPAKPDGSDGHMAPPSGDRGNPPSESETSNQ